MCATFRCRMFPSFHTVPKIPGDEFPPHLGLQQAECRRGSVAELTLFRSVSDTFASLEIAAQSLDRSSE